MYWSGIQVVVFQSLFGNAEFKSDAGSYSRSHGCDKRGEEKEKQSKTDNIIVERITHTF